LRSMRSERSITQTRSVIRLGRETLYQPGEKDD